MTAWIDANAQPPNDEQRVLACWWGPSCTPAMQSLTYHASDAHDSTTQWRDADGEEVDTPTHWQPLLPWPSECTSRSNGFAAAQQQEKP